jgi:preprotein translocase subunit SecB
MAETPKTSAPPPVAGANGAQQGAQAQVRIVAQYIKDLSFENPNIDKMLAGPGESPNINVEVNVGAKRMPPPDLYESAIEFRAKATSKIGTIYEVELVYGGLFKIEGIPAQSMEPFLLINCPTLLFPFVRRVIMDLTREAGYPPLLLDPIDFGGLYMNRLRQQGGVPANDDGPKTA